jgi:hypothetical protein
MVTYTCNPSYSGGRDEDDRGSKPARENTSMRPYLKKSVDCDVTDFYILSSCSIKFDRGVLNLSVIVSLQLSVFSGVAACVLKVCYGVFMIIISS